MFSLGVILYNMAYKEMSHPYLGIINLNMQKPAFCYAINKA